MKPDIHPEYRKVLFIDSATGDEWMTRSTLTSNEVQVVKLEISSFSHPFWTGKMRELDADGKIDRFRRRYASKK